MTRDPATASLGDVHKTLSLGVLTLVLGSCASPATLVVDTAFRAAAPEVVSAWQDLSPLRPARLVDLGLNGSAAAVRTSLAAAPGESYLVAIVLSAAERQTLRAAFPAAGLRFVGPGSDGAVLSLRRSDAWSAAARGPWHGEPGTVVYPLDASSQEMDAFAATWKAAGGGPLTVAMGAVPGAADPGQGPVFLWASGTAEAWAAALPAQREVFGNPGQKGPAGGVTATWELSTSGLGEALWKAALDRSSPVLFLPWESLSIDR